MNNYDPSKPFNDLPLLPPDKSILDNVDLWKLEAQSVSTISRLKGYAEIIPNQSILINAIVLQEAGDSSEIENIITTQDSLYEGMASSDVKIDSDTKEVIHYRKALLLGTKRIRKQGFLRLKDITFIQSILIGNDAGLRKLPGTQLKNASTGEIIYTPPEPQHLERLLANFIDYFNTCDPSIINMAICHSQFESIHPFYDGNGRTGRILNILFLVKHGYLHNPILYLSSFIIQNRDTYYSLLNGVNSKGDFFSWISFMIIGVQEVAVSTYLKIHDINILIRDTKEVIQEHGDTRKIYSSELVELLFENPYCKIDFLMRKFEYKRLKATRILDRICQTGVITKYKLGRESIYINNQLMELLKMRADYTH